MRSSHCDGSRKFHRARRRVRGLAAVALLAAGLAFPAIAPAGVSHDGGRHADISGMTESASARQIADWIVRTGDNRGLPFIVVDKVAARLFVFDKDGTVQATSPVLLGLARGDDSPPGIGNVKLAQMKPDQRITPAGRFDAAMGRNLSGQDILWIDYDAAVSLHRLTDPKPGLTARGRNARLDSATVSDNRVSHGCINVSGDFFDHVIRATFSRAGGVVYVLPETRSIEAEFHIAGSVISSQARPL